MRGQRSSPPWLGGWSGFLSDLGADEASGFRPSTAALRPRRGAGESLDGRPRRAERGASRGRGHRAGSASSHKTRCYPGARRQGGRGCSPDPDATQRSARVSRPRAQGSRRAAAATPRRPAPPQAGLRRLRGSAPRVC